MRDDVFIKKRRRERYEVRDDVVPVTGLEPVRCRHRWILSPLRLPIPSHRHTSYYNRKLRVWQEKIAKISRQTVEVQYIIFAGFVSAEWGRVHFFVKLYNIFLSNHSRAGGYPGSTRPYLTLIRSSFSSIGSAPHHKNSALAAAWMQSIGKPQR